MGDLGLSIKAMITLYGGNLALPTRGPEVQKAPSILEIHELNLQNYYVTTIWLVTVSTDFVVLQHRGKIMCRTKVKMVPRNPLRASHP